MRRDWRDEYEQAVVEGNRLAQDNEQLRAELVGSSTGHAHFLALATLALGMGMDPDRIEDLCVESNKRFSGRHVGLALQLELVALIREYLPTHTEESG